MIRPFLLEALGATVTARLKTELLKTTILLDIEAREPIIFRGHEWGKREFDAIGEASEAMDLAFALMKRAQFPELWKSKEVLPVLLTDPASPVGRLVGERGVLDRVEQSSFDLSSPQ